MEATDLVMGDRYWDTISGWEGTLTGRYEYLNGCVRVELSGAADGKPEGFIFDVQQVEPMAVGWVPTAEQEEAAARGERLLREAEMEVRSTGGPRPAPPRTGSR